MPPQSLIIFGGGPDSACLMSIAKALGWHVTIVAARPAPYALERFRTADAILIPPADDPVAGVPIDDRSAVVLMTHNYPRGSDNYTELARSTSLSWNPGAAR